jgi:putative spermidine/putrescine transport system ATP-binding protein
VKSYGAHKAVDDVSLDIEPGEFMTLLGPSGSGKTTTLNVIAGFVDITAGTLEVDGKPMHNLPPHKRDIGMVFQHYALFPHMTVADNIAFPLKQRKVSKAKQKELIERALHTVGLGQLGDRSPKQLSGGQQQRVALARALVYEPNVLLMDEPLGALDKKLRESLQLEIRRVQREVGSTFVFVTHDQEEALVLSDRIAVFNEGRVEQVGTAAALYNQPQTLFVAEFLGDSSTMRGQVSSNGDHYILEVAGGSVRATGTVTGTRAALVVRPEHIAVGADGDAPGSGRNHLPARVIEEIYLGSERKLELELADGSVILARESADRLSPARVGEQVTVHWDVEHGVLLAAEGGFVSQDGKRTMDEDD